MTEIETAITWVQDNRDEWPEIVRRTAEEPWAITQDWLRKFAAGSIEVPGYQRMRYVLSYMEAHR